MRVQASWLAVLFLGTGCSSAWPEYVPPADTSSSNAANSSDGGVDTGVPDAAHALRHRYAFDGDGTDSVGGATAVLLGGATVANGALVLDGVAAHAALPVVDTLLGLKSCTFDLWATWPSSMNQTWARIFDFGSGMTSYVMLTPSNGRADDAPAPGGLRVTMRGPDSTVEQSATGLDMMPTGKMVHITVTIDRASNTMTLYVDGNSVAVRAGITLDPTGLGTLSNDYLGRSQFPNDPFFKGSIGEFRIYGRALTSAEVKTNEAAGPDRIGVMP